MRRVVLILLVLAAGVALSACSGKGQSVATRTVTAPGTTSPEPPSARGSGGAKQAPRAKAALRFARAVNLQPGDVPGYRASTSDKRSTPAEKQASAELQHCVGRSVSARPLAEASSLNFQRGGSIAQQSVSSGVTVASSASVATSELNAIRGAHARSCFTSYIEQLFKGLSARGASIGPVSIAHGTPPAPNATGSFGLRVSTAIVLSAGGRSVRIPFYLDILGFVYGPTEVTLQSSGIPVPFPAANEQRLYTLLLTRARAHGV